MRQRPDVVVDAAEVARQVVAEDGRQWIVRVAGFDMVAKAPQQFPGVLDRCPLLLASTGERERWGLGAQRNSQPTRILGRGGDEPTNGTGGRGRHVEEQ